MRSSSAPTASILATFQMCVEAARQIRAMAIEGAVGEAGEEVVAVAIVIVIWDGGECSGGMWLCL